MGREDVEPHPHCPKARGIPCDTPAFTRVWETLFLPLFFLRCFRVLFHPPPHPLLPMGGRGAKVTKKYWQQLAFSTEGKVHQQGLLLWMNVLSGGKRCYGIFSNQKWVALRSRSIIFQHLSPWHMTSLHFPGSCWIGSGITYFKTKQSLCMWYFYSVNVAKRQLCAV